MATAPKFRIDVDIHNLLMDSSREPVKPAAAKGLTLPEPVFPPCPEKLADLGPEIAPEKRDWSLSHVYRAIAGMAFPLYTLARDARRIPSHHRLPVCRIQMQSRLLVLLGLQQQDKGHDRGCGAEVH